MKRLVLAVTALALGVGGAVGACSSDESGDTSTTDGGGADGSAFDGGGTDGSSFDGGTSDGGQADAADASDAQTGTPWLLVTMNYTEQSEMIVVGVDGGASPGSLAYDGGLGMTTVDSLGRPFALEEMLDKVVALDPAQPWMTRGSWDVHLDDLQDGGLPFADPVTVVPSSASKAYVIRFNRNKIAVIDPTQDQDAAAPSKTIDLSSLQDPTDTDTSVDPLGAVFVNGKLYVLLANLDFNKIPTKPTFALCLTSKPKVIAIDPATDAIQPVTTGAPAGGVELPGYSPLINGMVYDAPRHRLLVVQSGCNPELTDAGAGALQRREVDALDLATGNASRVLDLGAEPVPTGVASLGGDEIAIGFAYDTVRTWNVTTSSLGPVLASDLSAITSNARAQLYAARTRKFALDGGPAPDGGDAGTTTVHDAVEVPRDGGAPTVVGQVPASRDGGVPGWIDYFLGP